MRTKSYLYANTHVRSWTSSKIPRSIKKGKENDTTKKYSTKKHENRICYVQNVSYNRKDDRLNVILKLRGNDLINST